MGSETIKLPIIDFSNVEQGTHSWNLATNQVRQALEEYGCFEALFDKIPKGTRKATFDALKDLFNLPLQTKLKNRSNKPYHGYIGQLALVPLYESLGIGDALAPEKIENFTNLMWPNGNPTFSDAIRSFGENLSELDQMVRRMAIESLGVEKYMDEHMNSTDYLIRMQKYDEPQSDEMKLGLTSHTDKNIVTILYQSEVTGLQVLTKDGKWITLQPSFDSFIVMIGDSFLAWSNGRLHSAFHRVMMTGNEARYSIGLFSIPKAGYIIRAPEELVDEEHPLLFKPFDHVEFLDFYYSEAGRKLQYALQAYCGA